MLEWMLYDENDDEDVFECERMAAACAPVAMARAGWVDCCLYALLLIYSPSSTLHHALKQSGAGLECGSTSNHNHPFSNPTTISTHGYMAQTSESHSQTSGSHSQTQPPSLDVGIHGSNIRKPCLIHPTPEFDKKILSMEVSIRSILQPDPSHQSGRRWFDPRGV